MKRPLRPSSIAECIGKNGFCPEMDAFRKSTQLNMETIFFSGRTEAIPNRCFLTSFCVERQNDVRNEASPGF